MKNLRILFLVVLCIALTNAAGYSKDVGNTVPLEDKMSVRVETPDLGLAPGTIQRAPAQASTTHLAFFTFDSGPSCVDEGWISVDITVQLGDYWHVDDFAGLGGGTYGLLNPLEGNQSLWCGVRADPSSEILCGYASIPGYGNDWTQLMCSPCFVVSGDIRLTYLVAWDSEPSFDFTLVQYDQCDDNWFTVPSAANAGLGGGYHFDSPAIVDTVVFADSLHTGELRIRFNFRSDGAWSDSDGLWDTDGAIILDSITVTDGTGQLSFEDFESAAVGDNGAGDWNSCNLAGYGDFAALYSGLSLLQEDPCFSDLDCMWTFLDGTTATYACGGYPATPAIPYVNTRDQYIRNEVWSPKIPWIGTGSSAELQFNVYRDLTRDALIRYMWHVRSWVADCPGQWRDQNFVYYGPRGVDWFRDLESLGDQIEPGASHIQVALAVIDMCPFWCGTVGSGSCHSPAPYFDDVEVYRIATSGSNWVVRDIDLFQDNFAGDGTTTGTVRIDAAIDILPGGSPNNILPGDSIVVQVSDVESGLAGDAYTGFGPAVYGYVRVDPPQASKAGAVLSDDPFRWPVVDSTITADGNKWYIVRLDTAFAQPGRQGPRPDGFCLDLNDNLLNPGDQLWYFLGARSADAGGTWIYYFNDLNYLDNSGGAGAFNTTPDIDLAATHAEEMTCLPDLGLEPGNDILYVDDMDGRGAQPFFDTAFQQLGIADQVDRFDIRGPSSTVGNSLASRVANVGQQLIPWYKKIIWNAGNLDAGIMGDGVIAGEKSDDYALVFSFLDQSNRDPGFWISGDYIAWEWDGLGSASATTLRSVFMNFGLLYDNHVNAGLPISPLVTGAPGGIFDNVFGSDTLVAFGGCPGINEFDVMQQQGASVVQATYDGNSAYPAILSQQTTNAQGSTASFLLSGFSYHYIRDDRPAPILDRVIHLRKVLAFLGNVTDEPTGVKPAEYAYSLSQNYPNPFNPTTTIDYTLKERGDVTLRIYNVAGQLIRTLVDATRTPGEVHTATWDGRNDTGQSVSSGVYFYKLTAGSYVQTKKMVLLK